MKHTALVMVLVLTGFLGVGLAQQGTPEVKQVSSASEELANLRRLLALQQQQLELIQEQLRLTRQRILSISDPMEDLAMIEVEVKFIEVETNEPGAFERLLGLPESGGEINLVLDAAKFDELLARAMGIEGTTVVSRPKVAFRDGGSTEIANITSIPFYGVGGDVKFTSVGFEGQFKATVLPEKAIALSMDVEVKTLVGQSLFTAADGIERAIPEVTGRSKTSHATVGEDQGVVQGWLQARVDQTYRHVLCFTRPRILTAEEIESPF